MTPLIPSRDGAESSATVQVRMILNGYIGADTRSKTYVTAEEGDFAMPVMCWLITHKDKYYLWDLGMPEDLSLVNPHAGAWTYIPTVSKPLPDYLTTNGIQLDGTYLSHYHWDHCGDVSKVPLAYVGAGTKDGLMSRGGALTDTGFRGYQGPSDEGRINKLRELQRGDIVAEGLEGGNDMFGDGSFVIMPMPGHCAGHQIAICRTTQNPDTSGDSCHHSSLYAPCICHSSLSKFQPDQSLHLDVPKVYESLKSLTRLHDRNDTWVIIAHEYEAIGIVPEMMDLSDWKVKGYKDKIKGVRESESKRYCYALDPKAVR